MSSPNRRDSSRALRASPLATPIDEPTLIDARAPRFTDGGHRRGELPSIMDLARSAAGPARSAPAQIANRSAAGNSAVTNPPNVIPFTKPRAIAAIAAADPRAVVTMAPAAMAPAAPVAIHTVSRARSPEKLVGDPPRRGKTRKLATPPVPLAAPVAPTQMMASSPLMSAPPIPSSYAPPITPETPVATGWTPPHAVNAVAQPASSRSPEIAVTAWPIANAHAPTPEPSIAQPAHPAWPAQPAQPDPASPPTRTSRPALQMDAVPEPPPRKWAEYEQLGLGPPPAHSQQAAKLIVNAYRMLGFGILTIIVIVLVGYIASTAFYYFSNSWLVPMAVSPTDEKVVSLQSQLAEQQNARDRLTDELQQAERAILAQQTFQAEFARAIRSDLEGRKLALGRLRELATAAAQTRAAIRSQNAAYANASRRRMAEEYAAGLIDRTAMLSGKYQLAQITSSNLSLAERQAEFETRAAELEAQTRSLDAILANAQGDAGPALSYEVLRIKQEYEASRLDLAKSIEARDTLKAALARQSRIVASLEQSAYLRAVRDHASVAFVPYANLSRVATGTPLYACKLGMVFCYHAAEVLEVLPGEVQFKHPKRDQNLRGQIVVLKLDEEDPSAAADDVLFAGGRPILF